MHICNMYGYGTRWTKYVVKILFPKMHVCIDGFTIHLGYTTSSEHSDIKVILKKCGWKKCFYHIYYNHNYHYWYFSVLLVAIESFQLWWGLSTFMLRSSQMMSRRRVNLRRSKHESWKGRIKSWKFEMTLAG